MNDIKQFKSILKQGISRNTDVLLGCEFLEKLLNIINDYENTKNQLQKKDNIIKDIKSQLDYLETYSSKEDVFEDMKRRLNKIESIVNRK